MEIIWTNEAEQSYNSIADYIIGKWSLEVLNSFFDKTDEIIEIIKNNSEIGAPYKKTAYRQFLVSQQTYLFYKIEGDKIYLIVFWDNRKNPLTLDVILSS